jgi:hypothetical protein
MPIPVTCPSCKVSFAVRDEHAGKRGRCRQCKSSVVIPVPATSPTSAPSSLQAIPKESKRKDPARAGFEILATFGEPIRRVRTPLLYRFAALWVTAMLLLLPLVYVGLIALLGYGVYYHATENISIFKNVRSVRGAAFAYLTPIVVGGTAVLFMIKPLFAPLPRDESRRTLLPASEPLLFAFVAKVCEAIRAPAPGRIDVDCRVNASAHLARWILPTFMNKLVLTIGLPLVATMTVGQFAGLLAHEFGHFAQGAGMRLSYIIHSINAWFYRVVYERDAWDETLVAYADDEHWWFALVFQFARLMVWLSRRILWLLMMLAHILSCVLSRQKEYDADRRATRLVGSDIYAAMLTHASIVDVSASYVTMKVPEGYHSGRLCDDYPGLVRHLSEVVPDELRQAIRQEAETSRTDWFSTHPSDRDRAAQIQKEKSPGVFHSDLPATVLFRDFAALAKARTVEYYREVLDTKIPHTKLVPLADFLRGD